MANKLLVLFFIFITTVLGGELDSLLQKADRLSDRDPKTAFSIYKSAYEQAKKERSKSGKYHSLFGIITTGKALRKNINSYKNTFAMLNLPVLTDHRVSQDKLVLEFDRKLKDDDYRTFFLSKNRFVIDIYSDFPSKTIRIHNRFVKKITIGNYKKALSRVVLQSDKKEEYKLSIWKNTLIIEIEGKKADITIIKEEPPKEAVYKQKAYRQKIVVIDPGHGGKDSGAVGYGYKEKDVVLKISKKLVKKLKDRGYKVYMTRSRDNYIKLRHRTSFANRRKADIFISIHANASPVKNKTSGLEVYFLSPARTERAKRAAAKENAFEVDEMGMNSQAMFLNLLNREKIITSNKLAIDLQKGMLDSLKNKYSGVRDGGVREGPFWVLVGAQMPAGLVEVGYMSNRRECERLQNNTYQETVAHGIANGIDRFFINSRR